MGESAVFQTNGPALWGRVQRFLKNLLTRLWSLNALAGATVQDAFTVRCDRTTMTQNDLDNGRLIAQVTFTAAATIETITVTLAMETSGASVQEITANLAEVS
jgi:phage tail sheath protein FI